MNSQAKHTPGNWNYNSATKKIWADLERNGNNPVICELKTNYVSEDEAKENGSRIEKAVRLLSRVENEIAFLRREKNLYSLPLRQAQQLADLEQLLEIIEKQK